MPRGQLYILLLQAFSEFKQQLERSEKFRPELGFGPDLCDASAVLYQLEYSYIVTICID